MKSLHHLLELLDSGHRIIRVCREGSLDRIVVERLVSPVILIVFKTGLVYCSKVCRRQKLDICHSQFLQVIDTCRKTIRIDCTLLCKGKELTLVDDSRICMNRKVPVLKFINDDVRRLDLRTSVLCPSFRISLAPIDYSPTPSVHSHSLRCNAGSLVQPLTIHHYLECVERSFQVFSDCNLPKSAFGLLHVAGHECRSVLG